MDIQTRPAQPDPPVAPPFDSHARDRTEQVATALLDLCGRLEARIDALEQRCESLEASLDDLTGDGRRG